VFKFAFCDFVGFGTVVGVLGEETTSYQSASMIDKCEGLRTNREVIDPSNLVCIIEIGFLCGFLQDLEIEQSFVCFVVASVNSFVLRPDGIEIDR
jgi:hypothetical protein